jgi:hypothetical protein
MQTWREEVFEGLAASERDKDAQAEEAKECLYKHMAGISLRLQLRVPLPCPPPAKNASLAHYLLMDSFKTK